MATKIEGWAAQDYEGDDTPVIFAERPPIEAGDQLIYTRATVVLHHGKPERVFTKSEVEAMLRRLDKAYLGFDAPTMRAIVAEGFSLDPA